MDQDWIKIRSVKIKVENRKKGMDQDLIKIGSVKKKTKKIEKAW